MRGGRIHAGPSGRIESILLFLLCLFHPTECNGTVCQADSATAKRNGPTGGGHCESLAYWSFHLEQYSSLSERAREGERERPDLHPVPPLFIYTVPWRYTKQALGQQIMGSFSRGWRDEATKDAKGKKISCEILMLFFFVFFISPWCC